jgi:acyl-CoA synthetase (AMP-forming)/AMP-acid ligase II
MQVGITQCLHRMDRQAPNRAAAVDAGGTLNWNELSARVATFAGALQERGLTPGGRVAMLARNGTDFLVYVLGTFWAGGVINPVNLRWTAGEIGYSLENCQTRFLIVDPEFAALVPDIRAAAPGLSHVVETGARLQAWIDAATPVKDALRRGDDLAAILYTGGTTGFPKGVMLSHTNLVSSMLGSIACQHGLAGDRYLHTAPLFHIGALSGLFVALFSGSTNHFLPAFEPLAVIEAVARDRIAELFLVPTMIRMVVDHPRFAEFEMGSVQRVRYGASSIDGALLDRAIAAFPNAGFVQAYGMTELSPTVTILGPEDHGAEARANGRLLSAGRATPTTEVRIVGPDDEELPCGDVGEIVARGPTVMLGYWQMPEATAEAMRGGWMHTGDLGRMDDEGYITVVDRLKDMIITGGENVYSAEVENALATHHDVAGLAVVAVPDPKWGERVHTVVVPRGDVILTPDALIAHCRNTLAGYKIPRSFAFVDALPLSAAGKVLKNVLRDAAARDDTTVKSPGAGRAAL